MLKKKQYFLTLLIGVMLFFILFIISYYYMRNSAMIPETTTDNVISRSEKSVDVLANTKSTEEETVQIDTHIHLLVVDKNNNTIDDKNIDPLTLLGLSQIDIQDKFQEYELVTFNEREIALKKVLAPENMQVQYRLGIQDDVLCIVENGETKQYTKLNVLATHFSRQIYSLLLKEQIQISAVQKDELLNNPAYIEKILQSCEEE
ncbi:MAG: hypothetical protein K0S71_541 [Clostridia bacterium]|jgi:hypothetical protein|nr:hypothetical protein [Clostridia bacterium]